MKTMQKLFVILALVVIVLGVTQNVLAAPGFTGTYQTDTKSGTISFAATRCIQNGWCNGNWTVDGVRYPGYFFVLRDGSGRVAMNFFYDRNFNKPAGALLSTYSATDATYSGPITFYAKDGTVTGTGTATLQ